MPTASVGRLEKQASLDACEPLRQGITMIEHKIRNLEKRKARLDQCRDLQKSGKDLNSDQLEAISKYDAVISHLEFARELSKQLSVLATDSTKQLKVQARKEAKEKAQQDLNRIKEILLIQDVLTSMGLDTVREDFLSGNNKVTLTAEELQSIDDLYIELTPKKEEPLAFSDMFQAPAEAMLALVEGKNKEACGTTYTALKAKLLEVANSGYFDNKAAPPPAEEQPVVEEEIQPAQPEEVLESVPVAADETEDANVRQIATEIPQHQQTISTVTFQPTGTQPVINAATPEQFTYAQQAQPEVPGGAKIETTYFTPSHLRVFKSGTIDFMQENEIDTPESVEQPSAIPTMTYTNQSFGSPIVDHHTQPPPIETQSYQNQTDEEKGWNTVASNSIETTVIEPSNPAASANAWGVETTGSRQRQSSPSGGNTGGDDWVTQTEHWQQTQQNTHNDGFITAGGNRGRGGRGRGGGGGGDRNKGYPNKGGGRGGSNQSGGRGGFREGGYNRDRGEGGYNNRDRNDGGYYNKDQNMNGYKSGGRGGGGGGGNRNRNNPVSDMPGGRGGGGRGGRGGGGYRGGNNTGGYRQQQVQ